MKVAIVTTRHGAQDDRIYHKQALSLSNHMNVTMIAPDDGEDLSWPEDIHYRPIPRRSSPWGRLWSLVEAVAAVYRERPEFCHLHDLDLALVIPFLKTMLRTKVIYDSHEAFPQQFLMRTSIPSMLRPAVAKVADVIEKFCVGFGDHVVTADNPTRDSFSKTKLPACTVFNYPPLHIFETDSKLLNEEKRKYENKLPIIYQGTVSPDRGLFHMIDALKLLKESEPEILLRIVGLRNNLLRKTALEKAAATEVGEELEIVDWLPHLEISYAIKSSLIGLVPLQPEEKYKRNIPIKVFEYMACGIPVVAADLPSIRPYIEESDAGVLYDSTRPEELARCVLELLSDPEKRAEMGQNGLRAVRAKWNWKEMEKVLWRVYESLGASREDDKT